MTNTFREYLNKQEESIKEQYSQLEEKGFIDLLKKEVSVQERKTDIKNIIRRIYEILDVEKEISIG